jgi:hypothetical protein
MSTQTSTHGNSTHQTPEERSVAAIARDERISATEAAMECFSQYAREKPEIVTLWAFGIGFVLGWKLKPW